MRDFRQYEVWKNAVSFTTEVYKLTAAFPPSEKFGLVNQLQRASVSIASNIAEGASRTSEKDFTHFLEISLGSSFEVETQLLISKKGKLGHSTEEQYSLSSKGTMALHSCVSEDRRERQQSRSEGLIPGADI